MTAADPLGGGSRGSLSGKSVGFNIYKEYKEGHTHNWTILSSISFFSRGPSRTTKASITLSTRGSGVSPYALGSIFTRRTGRTSRSRITLEGTHDTVTHVTLKTQLWPVFRPCLFYTVKKWHRYRGYKQHFHLFLP